MQVRQVYLLGAVSFFYCSYKFVCFYNWQLLTEIVDLAYAAKSLHIDHRPVLLLLGKKLDWEIYDFLRVKVRLLLFETPWFDLVNIQKVADHALHYLWLGWNLHKQAFVLEARTARITLLFSFFSCKVLDSVGNENKRLVDILQHALY